MAISRTDKIAVLSVLASLLRVASGPITLIAISYLLTAEELGFYYAFFGVIGMKMLFEAGMSNVIKVTYSHISLDDYVGISNLYKFSKQWYLLVSILLSIFLFVMGMFYFSSYDGKIEWKGPWYLLIFTTSCLIAFSYIEAYLDGCQKQIELKIIQILNSFSVIFLWISLYSGMGLYSIGLMQVSNLIIYLTAFYINSSKFLDFDYSPLSYKFTVEFLKLWNLLRNVLFVWILGYFFWNGFNLLAFKLYDPIIAGSIGLSLAIAKTGYTIAGSVLVSQMTVISKSVSEGKQALNILIKYLLLSMIMLVLGYSGYFFIKLLYPDIIFFSRVISDKEIILIFFFFILVHLFVSLNNYVRAYKIEPFVMLSFFNSIFTPLSFYLTYYFSLPYFSLPLIIVSITTGISISMFITHIRGIANNEFSSG